MIIGLTGGIGSGKSTVAQFFRELGVKVLDSDQITRRLMEPQTKAFHSIVQHFGPDIVKADGTLDRGKLRTRVFQSSSDRLFLEDLLHPEVKTEIEKERHASDSSPYFVVEIPLLIEAEFQDAVDRILVVDCSKETQIERVSKRDSSEHEEIKAIMESQVSREQRLQFADDVMENEGSLDALRQKVRSLHDQYIKLTG